MKAIRNAIKMRKVEFMALNQVYHQYLTSVKQKTISLWTDIFQSTRFVFRMMFTRPTVSGTNQFDIGALCI
ncbi:hypothetical protein MHK_006482 [Candidatus Magnetomorum sp. HK-1]|nr:hypothetical protein MHK_006482 [Candidatus Magnetomorum sp. HK-1]